MYKYKSVHDLSQLLAQDWRDTDEFQLDWELEGENNNDQLIHFKIKAHDKTVLETTCDIYNIEINTYKLDKDVQEWFDEQWDYNYERADIVLPYEKGQDIELGDKVVISDPCYDLDTGCNGVLENVKPGTWRTKAENLNINNWGERCSALIAWHEDVEEPDEDDYELTGIDVGVDSGQAGIYDYDHFAYIKDDKNRDENWYDSIRTFGSVRKPMTVLRKYLAEQLRPLHKHRIALEKELGRGSLFDNPKYLEAYRSEKNMEMKTNYYGVDEQSLRDGLATYHVNCIWTDKHSVVTSSGLGDGSYDCYVAKNEAGQIIGIKIDYFSEYEDEVE
jgi:hypothetical protein